MGGKQRHEDFNRSIFDLEQFLLEHSGLGYSCFLYKDPYCVFSTFILHCIQGRFVNKFQLRRLFSIYDGWRQNYIP